MKSKEKRGTIKGTLLKIAVIGFLVLLIFGSMKSCVKVNAVVYEVNVGTYIWDTDIFVDGSYVCKNDDSMIRYYSSLDSNLPIIELSNGVQYKQVRFLYSYFRDESVNPVINGLKVTCRYYNSDTDYYDVYYIRYYFTSSTLHIYDYSLIDSYYFVYNLLTLNLAVANAPSNTGAFAFVQNMSIDMGFANADYASGYSIGYQAGTQIANDNIWNQGRNEGYNDGITYATNHWDDIPAVQQAIDDAYEDGKNDGYQEGLNTDNPYTFKNLFFAVLDVPVQTITGLFNWNFLGVNLKDFVFTILTLGLIAFLIKRIL